MQSAEATQVQYKQLMGTDKVFKHFRVLDLLKNNARWIELSQVYICICMPPWLIGHCAFVAFRFQAIFVPCL
jgi:hypothetical protein